MFESDDEGQTKHDSYPGSRILFILERILMLVAIFGSIALYLVFKDHNFIMGECLALMSTGISCLVSMALVSG